MKKINYLFYFLFLSVAILASCKSDDGGGGPTAEEAAVAKLQGSWEVIDAKRDNVTEEDYVGMMVVINSKNISATGAPSTSVFPTGNFTFVDENYNKILVDNVNVTLNVTDTNLITSFALDEEGNDASSRVTVVQGSYIFTFSKVE